jgi:BolA family transcriptional regulator, general stress-responsive regulator
VSTRLEAIRRRLADALAPLELQVVDESYKHVGHEGARDGRGHFAVRIVSAAFEGEPLLARHRRVYEALGALMQTDIHALSLQAIAPSEK